VSEQAFDPFPLLAELRRHDVEFVVIGALAAIAQGYPLATRDLDITPSRGHSNLERLAAALRELQAKLRTAGEPVDSPIEASYLANVDSWTLLTTAGELDILFEPAGTRGYADLRRDAKEVTLGVPVWVASLRDVIRMKESAGREKDRAQLPALRRTLELLRRREAATSRGRPGGESRRAR
jgi:hypothetical protein